MMFSPKIPSSTLAIAACLLLGSAISQAENRFANSNSPHLVAHGAGPVDWHPWSDEVFKLADERKKMVYASVGYHACHWCQRMQKESFSNPSTAALLNDKFVCVKIDRLERPDLDLTFRSYAGATGNSTGWPLNIWLTPAGTPVSVASYLNDGNGKAPGSELLKIANHVEKQWKQHPKYIHEQSLRDRERITSRLERKPLSEFPEALDYNDAINNFTSKLSVVYDPKSGGFDAVIKFPRPEVLETLTLIARREKADSFRRRQAEKMLTKTLDGMLAGAIIDPLDGGMFRYANDSNWIVPQFEKMLADQARIAEAFLGAYQLTADERYARAARGLLAFMQSKLGAPDGTFYSSLSSYAAAEPGGEPAIGAHRLWQYEQFAALLNEAELKAFTQAFGIQSGGNLPNSSVLKDLGKGANILIGGAQAPHKPADGSALATALEKVRAAQASRPEQPERNEMIIASWNGLAISAFSRAASVLGDREFLAVAQRCAGALSDGILDPESGTLRRGRIGERAFGKGFAEDYLFLARGMLDLYFANGSLTAFDAAEKLQGIADRDFYDPVVGMYHLSAIAERNDVPFALWSMTDTDLPSYVGAGALNLLDLAAIDGKKERRQRVEEIVRAATPELEGNSTGCPSIIRVIGLLSRPNVQVVVSGNPSDPATAALLSAARRHTPAEVPVISVASASVSQALIAKRKEFSKFSPAGAGKMYLCRDLTPGNPTSDPRAAAAGLKRLLESR